MGAAKPAPWSEPERRLEPAQSDTARPPSPARRAQVARELARLLPEGAVLWRDEDLRPFECDGLSAFRQMPMVVVMPLNEAQVMEVLRCCHRLEVPVVARGAGTGLSGGAMPHASGVVLSLARLNRIVHLDPHARLARVEPGVRNLAISEAAAPYGLYYAPDPSSQIACTIGGNIAENSGGVHCLKYGLTIHNVLRVRAISIEGEVLEFGSEALDSPGLDVLAALIGSEGMLAVVTEVTVRLIPKPRLARVDYYCMDGTIPRKHLGSMLRDIAAMEEKYALRCMNVFHAGDGNLHPLILFDANDPDQWQRAERFGSDILERCVDYGGTITGEHGVGVEKINSMCVQFSDAERAAFFALKRAFDAQGLLNPGKAIPTLARCAEHGKMHVHRGQVAHPELERF
ncbi:MAG: FAD-binding protein [Betaproteobacteria bacterium]|nr:FAD-binding protein [Betaproteobacteria bacterium]